MSTSGSTFTDWQQLEDSDRPLLVDDDFSWSDVPVRRSRRAPAVQTPPAAPRKHYERDEREGRDEREERKRQSERNGQSERDERRGQRELTERRGQSERDERLGSQEQASRTDADFEAARRSWSASYEDQRPRSQAPVPAPAPVSAPAPVPAPAVRPSIDLNTDGFDRDDAASYATARVLEDRSGALDLRHSGRRTVIITGRGDSRYTLPATRRRASELRFHERSGFNPDRTAMWAVLLGIALLIGCIAH